MPGHDIIPLPTTSRWLWPFPPLHSFLLRTLFLLPALLTGSVADEANLWRNQEYANGFNGAFPLQRYRSADIQGPILNYWQHSQACDEGWYTILAPRGDSVRHSGPMILDAEGHLVWFKEYPTTYNANVYTYKGEKYLTFWAGNDAIGGHGDGTAYLINSHYEEAYKIKGTNGLPADLHEFHITIDDTAVFAVYDIALADLREAGGSENGWIWDGLFQEVDVETNELIFQWRASEHFSFSEVERDREGNGDSQDRPWDFFHLNSIDKDEAGNFLISSRYMGCLVYIDGRTGNVIWILGGKASSFRDLSDGAATDISWQHHARFQPDYDTNATRAITIFDNSSRGKGAPENPSRGLFIDINEEEMTATVRNEYWNPLSISSQSQGSMQILENGNVLVGYGYNAAWTEFGPDGEVLCQVYFGPESGFYTGQIISYRVFKQEWVGLPLTRPDVALSRSEAAVSWNGATEVRTWALQGAFGSGFEGNGTDRRFADMDLEDEDAEFEFISAVPKTGFETVVPISPDTLYSKLRIIALDKDGAFLGATESMDWEPEKLNEEVAVYEGNDDDDDEDDDEDEVHIPAAFTFGMGFVTATVIVLCAWLVCRYVYSGSWGAFRKQEKEQDGGVWEAIHSGEELDELSDLENGDRADDSLLKGKDEDK